MTHTDPAPQPEPNPTPPTRCLVVVDEALPPGLAANAVGVLALTLGATVPGLIGADLVDADGEPHPGLIPQGLPVLSAPRSTLSDIRARARAAQVGVIDFPRAGQQTNDYDEFRQRVAAVPTPELKYLGVLLHGPRRTLNKLTGNLALHR